MRSPLFQRDRSEGPSKGQQLHNLRVQRAGFGASGPAGPLGRGNVGLRVGHLARSTSHAS